MLENGLISGRTCFILRHCIDWPRRILKKQFLNSLITHVVKSFHLSRNVKNSGFMLALVFDMLHQELPCGSDVGVEGVGVDAVDGGATVTLWLLQLWPVQHSMLQSSKVQF